MAAVVVRLTELGKIEDLAVRRRAHAIMMLRTSVPPISQEEAEDRNRIEDHRKGVAAEFAVAQWLSDLSVSYVANFENVAEDFAGAPDISVATPPLHCDVKTSWRRYPERQRRSLDRKDVVIWCFSRPAEAVAFDVDIYGWSETQAIKAIPSQGASWIDVPNELVKSPQELLARLGL